MQRELGEQQLSTATFVAEEINDELEVRVRALESMAGKITLAALKNPAIVQDMIDHELVLQTLFNGGIFALSSEGIAIANFPHSIARVGTNFSDRKYAIGALKNGKSTIGNPVLGRVLKSQVFSMAAPIRDPKGVVIGALAASIDLAQPNFLDKVTQLGYGKAGGYLLVSPENRLIVTATDKNRIMQQLPAPGINPFVDRHINGQEGSDIFINPLGVEVLDSAKNIPIAGWYVVVYLPTTEAFAPIHNMQQRLMFVAVTLAGSVCLLVWWMLKRQLSPVTATAKSLTEMLNSKQSFQPLPVTRRDEIGELIGGFNLLFENLGQQKDEIRLIQTKLEAALNSMSDAVSITDSEGRFINFNESFIVFHRFGSKAKYLQTFSDYSSLLTFYSASGVLLPLEQWAVPRALRGEAASNVEFRLQHNDTGESWIGSYNYAPIRDDHANIVGSVVTARDITKSKLAEENLRITASVFDSSQEAIVITDADNNITDVNPAFTHITGYSRDEVLGKNPRLMSSALHDKEFYTLMWESLIKNRTWRGEIWNRRKSGEIFAEQLSISALCNNDGQVQRYVAVFSDISHIKAHEAELSRVAHYDALTEIPNRVLLADRMKQAIAQTSRDKNMMAVCYLDLDGFKPINDTMGHEIGDQVLIEVAKRVSITIRGGDTVARLGGDEFVVLLLGLYKAEECVTTLERILEAIARPIIVKDRLISLTVSIGVSIYPQDEEDPDILLRHANQAMYVSKQSGKNRYHIYDTDRDLRTRNQNEFLKSIRYALSDEQFVLYYQPKVNLRTRELVGAEALIRWQHPVRGVLSPVEFLRHIEKTELDIQIGEWVIATALNQMHQWHKDGINIEVSVNISGYHLESPNFVEHLQKQLALYPDIAFGKLQIEVLETVALNDISIVSAIIESCRKFGVGFALDDFGTGYSSLAYLSKLPVDTLKIDQSFVRDMLGDKGDMAIVQGIIALASAFDRHTVAEGIETVDHYRALLDMGCELGQGYGIARPMPADELQNWQANIRF